MKFILPMGLFWLVLTACGAAQSSPTPDAVPNRVPVAPQDAPVETTDADSDPVSVPAAIGAPAQQACPDPVIADPVPLSSGRFCDPVPVRYGAVSATDRDPASVSLRPDVTCADSQCEIRMKIGWGGTTLLSEPLAYSGGLFEGDDWMPRPMDAAQLERGPEGTLYGWTVGYEERETDIYVAPIKDRSEDAMNGRFIVEQWAGFEHVGIDSRVIAVQPDGSELSTLMHWPNLMGPARNRVTHWSGLVKHAIFDYTQGPDGTETEFSYYEFAVVDGQLALIPEDHGGDHFE